jgi:hypothetical protein
VGSKEPSIVKNATMLACEPRDVRLQLRVGMCEPGSPEVVAKSYFLNILDQK